MPFQTDLLVEVFRGGRLESEHRGAIAVADADGRLLAHIGDPHLVTYLRSSAKPFQQVPLVSSGAADRLGLTPEEIAVAAGSHSGEPKHILAVRSILSKSGFTERVLQCGVDSNCSGKHAGMLALAADLGATTDDYLANDHPVQIAIREAVCDLFSVKEEDLGIGIDGCSAPNFTVPLMRAAQAFARLANHSEDKGKPRPSFPTLRSLVGEGKTWSRSDALAVIARSMMDFPDMVAGNGRLDTDVMKILSGRVVLKGGAEGFQGIGILKTGVRKAGIKLPIGVAIKIADGNGRRAVAPVVVEVLNQLGVVDESELKKLGSYRKTVEKNLRGIPVGEAVAGFQLRWD